MLDKREQDDKNENKDADGRRDKSPEEEPEGNTNPVLYVACWVLFVNKNKNQVKREDLFSNSPVVSPAHTGV